MLSTQVRDAIASLGLPASIRDQAVFVDGVYSPGDSALTGWLATADGGLRATGAASDLAVLHVGTSTGGSLPVAFEIPENQHARVLECWTGGGFSERRLNVRVGANASLEWTTWQNGIVGFEAPMDAEIASGGHLTVFALQSNCGKVKAPMRINLAGERAEASLFGLSFVQGESLVDQEIQVEHAKPHTRSKQLFKSVLRDRAVNIFSGRVLIAQDAQKSDASQRHQSLNLHSTAEAITKPELEIYADDVKAAHGATIGRLDENQLFYLETRGISRREGTELLARAFVQDILNQMKSKQSYAYVDGRLGAELPGFLAALEKSR